MDRPNIFSIATKELSQDAFITWLIQWADSRFKNEKQELHTIGKEFVKLLICKKYKIEDFDISKVEVGRQWGNIDIWADINEEYFLIIEDKIETNEHDDQLKRYEKTVLDYYGSTRKLVCIYLKTGLDSLNTKAIIEGKGWFYCSRKDFYKFLSLYSPNNDIYNDYVLYLKEKEDASNAYTIFENLNYWEPTKGLYLYLQEFLQKNNPSIWSHWEYVPNRSGGFLGFWFHFTKCKTKEKQEFYLQIENNLEGKCNLIVKLCGEWNHTTDYLYNRLEYLNQNAQKFGLSVSKPSRFKPGEYTSLAMIDNVFINKNGKLDMYNLLEKIKKAIELVSDLSKNS